MKFGLFCPMDFYPTNGQQVKPESYYRFIEQAKLADELYYDSFWIAEGHFGYETGICPSPAVFLSRLFAETRRIKMGPAVCVLPLHHPIEVAENFALLDVLSEGRLLVGFGSGFLEESFRGFGIPIQEKQERFLESLEIIKLAWVGETFSYNGKYHRIVDVQLNVLPLTTKEIWISATRPEFIKFLAKEGYSLIVSPFISRMSRQTFVDTLQDVMEIYKQENIGKTRENIGVVIHVHVGQDMSTARRIGLEAFRNRIKHIGRKNKSTEDLTNAVRSLRMATKEGWQLFGDVSYVREGISILQEFGVKNVLLLMDFGGIPQKSVLRSMELFAEHVIAYFSK